MYQIRLVQSFSPFATTPIYSPDMQDSLPVESGHFTLELNEGGSLEFTLPYTHPYYEALTPLSSYVQVTEDGEEIFYGRIYDKSEPTLTGRISYQAEGALSFLQDSEISPESKDAQGNYNTRTLSAEAFFRWCIQQHNADVADPRRQFTVGNVTASRKGETDEYQITSFTETKSALSQYILDRYGGVLRVRPGSNGAHYIDWVQDYGVTNPQPVEIGSNVTDMTNAISGDGVFTVLRPVGANGLTLTPNTINVFPAEKVAEYGRIVKTVTFGDADTEEKLRAKANTYISRIEKKMTKETQVSLVDFHFLDGNIPKIRIGHMFTNIRGMEGETMTVFNWDQDILSVDKGQFTLKNKKDLDSVTDGRVKGGTISKSSARGSKAGSLALKYYHEGTDEAMLEVKKLTATVDEAQIKIGELDVDIQGTADIAADALTISTNNLEVISRVENRVDNIEDVSIAGMEVRIQNIEGTAVIKNSDTISTVAGEFEIWEDQATGKKTVHLKDGAELAVDKDGAYITVGGLNDTLGQHEEVLGEQSVIINEMTGSALWTTRDDITEVVGEFDVIWIPDPDNPGEFIKKLKIQSGGGVVINRNNTEFGLFDEGNLTGGVIVEKINEDDYTTTIKGSRVIIGDQLTDDDLETWAQDAKYGRGVFAKYLTVKKLTAEEITTLLANIGNATITNMAVTNNISAQGFVQAAQVVVGTGGYVRFNGSDGGGYYDLTMSDVDGMIVDALVDGNTLKLWKKGDPAASPSITFSKATSLSGAWSGNRFTVTASPQGVTYSADITHTAPYQDSEDDNKWKVRVYSTDPSQSGTPPPEFNPPLNHYINLQSYLSNAYDGSDASHKITSNGPYVPSGSSIIGFSRVVVDVDASVTTAWEQSNPTQDPNLYNKFTGRNASGAVKFSETITASIAYNSTLHKYVATVNGTSRSSVYTAETADTDAVNYGKANATITTGWEQSNPSVSTNPYNRFYVKREGDTVKTQDITASISYNSSLHKYVATVNATDRSGIYSVEVADTSGYNRGWDDATSSSNLSIPTSANTGASMNVKYPLTNPSRGSSTTRTYTLTDDGNNAVKLYTSVASGGQTQNVTVATYTHNKYTSGYSAGWGAAYGKQSIPVGSNTGSSMTVKYAPNTVDGAQQSRTYYLANDGDNAVKLYTSVSSQEITVAKYTHNKYTSGQNSVTITKSYKTNGVVEFTKSAGTTSTKGVKIQLTTGNWSGNTLSWDIKDYYDSTSGTTVLSGSFNATARYNAGYSAGQSNPTDAVVANKVAGYGWPGSNISTATCTVTRFGSNADLVLTMHKNEPYVDLRNQDGGTVARLNIGSSTNPTWVGLWDSDPRLSFDVNYIGDVNGANIDQWALIKSNDTPISCFRVMGVPDSGGSSGPTKSFRAYCSVAVNQGTYNYTFTHSHNSRFLSEGYIDLYYY